MKKIALALLVSFILGTTATAALACEHSWETAADGSICGGRAADQRPGGR